MNSLDQTVCDSQTLANEGNSIHIQLRYMRLDPSQQCFLCLLHMLLKMPMVIKIRQLDYRRKPYKQTVEINIEKIKIRNLQKKKGKNLFKKYKLWLVDMDKLLFK